MIFLNSLKNSLISTLVYGLYFAAGMVCYRSLSSWLLEPYWAPAATLALVLFPVMSYLLLSRIAVKYHDGRVRFFQLFFSGLLMNWLAAVAVGTVSVLDARFEWRLFGNTEPSKNISYFYILKGYLKWYSIFGIASTLLAIGVLYLKSKLSR